MILQYPHPLLRKKIEYDLSLNDTEVLALLYDEAEREDKIHRKHGLQIVGLAANQIGIETRILLYRAPDKKLSHLIDPMIIAKAERTETEIEGCGSLPNYFAEITRPAWIIVESKNDGVEFYDGWAARVIQHEVDHLDGILLLDYESQHLRNE